MGDQGDYTGVRFWSLCGYGQCSLNRRTEQKLEMSSVLKRLEGKASWVISEERIPGTGNSRDEMKFLPPGASGQPGGTANEKTGQQRAWSGTDRGLWCPMPFLGATAWCSSFLLSYLPALVALGFLSRKCYFPPTFLSLDRAWRRSCFHRIPSPSTVN